MKFKLTFILIAGGSQLLCHGGQAQFTLRFQYADGTALVYDSAQDVTWTQDGDISGQTFDYADARNWAASLSLGGVGAGGWQLPDAAQFTSLYSQLEGTDHKYGAQVFFGTGGSDFVSNVDPEYWTDTDGTDFNFYYGYPGSQPDESLYAGWAVTPGRVPEPSCLTLGSVAGGLVLARIRRWRNITG